MSDRQLMAVRSALVKETLVERICDRVVARLEDELPAAELARRLASREPLERPALDDPDAASWRAPGPGGHVRHYVAQRLIASRLPLGALRPADDVAQAALKRDFIYGFLIRCCEEAVADDPSPRPD